MNQSMPSPMSMASRKRSSSLSSVESFDSDFFEQTYVPLSNLPTPPLSSHSCEFPADQSPISLFSSDEILDPELIGPAIHLTNLIPSSTSLTDPSIQLVHNMLTRAGLPTEILALAVCILDSLNSRFARSWRQAFPLHSSYSDTLPTYLQESAHQHIDSIHPEIIILSALILATKFLDDDQSPTSYYAAKWAQEFWTCDQINFTQRCIMENLGYRLLPLCDEDIIREAKMDMERARKLYVPPEYCLHDEWSIVQPMSSGKACTGIDGIQPTPAETPMLENMGRAVGTSTLSRRTKFAFRGEGFNGCEDAEQFPLYVDPLVRNMNFGY